MMATASATGLKALLPMPPKICLPITTAIKVPVMTAHHGIVAGNTIASSRPIRAALPSPIVGDFFMTLLMSSSQSMAVATDRPTTPITGTP